MNNKKLCIGIIGAGNMGGAVARGLAERTSDYSLIVSDMSTQKLNELHEAYPSKIEVTTDNGDVARKADILITAVKPWLVQPVYEQIGNHAKARIVVSIAAGVSLQQVSEYFGHEDAAVFRAMPNTAIAYGKSVTLLAHNAKSTAEDIELITTIFQYLGSAPVIEEHLMNAGMALCSCGIAYIMRYVRAATEGAVELGLYPGQAKALMLETMEGAIAVLRASGANPEAEIDKVTTPGGTTIRGLNAMEHEGFSNAVIAGLLASGK